MDKAGIEAYLETHDINKSVQTAINSAVKVQSADAKAHIAASLIDQSGLKLPGLASALQKLAKEPATKDPVKFLLAEMHAEASEIASPSPPSPLPPTASLEQKPELQSATEQKPMLQSAFVFTKPHANTPEVRELVARKFKEMGIEIVTEGDMDGPTIDSKKHIDQHYYAIASKATLLEPKDLNVPKEKFKAQFDEEWDAALAENKLFNAMDAIKHLEIDVPTLNTAWQAAQAAKQLVKLGGGFYCGKLELEGKPPIYVLNGFFMTMREKFTSAEATIHYYVVQFDAAMLPWADFRGKVLGPTDPAAAPAESLRGTLHADWAKLGMAAAPDTSDNGVHASASPFEGLAERMNWLSVAMADDVFGKALLGAGIAEETIKEWAVDPQVTVGPDSKKGSLFDQLEDLDCDECLAKATALAELQ